ncbi:MAG: Ig-like domain-containing protein [Acidobacteriota bacterium]|nr:Ig-like domain-containing protein [Acidobacteriota bacterium]
MKRKALILPVIAAGAALLGAPSALARRVERVDSLALACQSQMLGAIDVPVDGATVSGYVQVIGFALDGSLLSNIDVFVDGTDEANRVTAAGGANINLPRPDVLQFFPQYGGTAGKNPGYQASFKASLFSNGSHTVYVRATDVNGCSYFLTPRAIKVDNARNQPPFGAVSLPFPDSGVSANGVLKVAGWALDDRKVDHVDVYVDGLIERQAVTGIYRADVAAEYPDNPQAMVSGFVLNIDSSRYANGVHTVTVKAVDDQGQQGLLGSRRVQIFNNAPDLAPFGEVEFPLLNASWFGNCFPVPPGGPSGSTDIIDPRYLMFVSGWAMDTSVALERGGVAHVSVEMDGVVLKDSRINCHREFLLSNALIDCYGYYRPDIEVLYPGFQQAPNVGFQFFIDVGYLITQRGFKEGAHMLQIKALDKEDSSSLLKEVPIVMECATGNLDPPPIGSIDAPTNYKFIGGVFPVVGWALDLDLVAKVRILIDGVPQIDAVRGVDYADYGYASPDIATQYPNYPQRNTARFRFFLDTTQISNSEHDLLIEVTDTRANVRSAGTRRFIVDNNTLVR